MWALLLTAVLLACGSSGNSSNTTLSDAIETCEALPHGLWSRTLEDWATSTHVQSSDRHGKKIPTNYETDYEGQNITRIKGYTSLKMALVSLKINYVSKYYIHLKIHVRSDIINR